MTVVDAAAPRSLTAHPDGYRHEAFIYADEASYLAGTVPFVQGGIDDGEPVLVMVPGARLDLLREALGPTRDSVLFADMTDVGRNPARIIPAWAGFLEEYAGRPVRGIGEPIWAGRRPAELVECQFHEALLNRAVDRATPFRLRCPYDASALAADVLREAAVSHPIVAAPRPRRSKEYDDDPSAFFGAPLPDPDVPAELLVFGERTLAEVRDVVSRRATEAGLDAATVAGLALATHEVATNSVRHGSGVGRLRVWRDPDALVCEVSDTGVVADPLVGRRRPDFDAEGGRGLWLAHHLCDLVQIRSGVTGTTVRISTWL